jgi:CO/xanthine dehydrogenase Mo-binding subunit
VNDQLSTYIIPTALDVPEVRALFVEHPFPWGPHGAKGLGEAPLISVAPAVTAAIAHAVGVRLTEIPATPERVWAALAQRGAAGA